MLIFIVTRGAYCWPVVFAVVYLVYLEKYNFFALFGTLTYCSHK